jgi:DnaJ homolog subfamily A member 2
MKVTAHVSHFTRTICTDCSGTGKFLREKDRCKKCKGKATLEEKKPLEFWIEKGMEDGDPIVLKGEADQVPFEETGDVVFVLRVAKHNVFSRFGKDLKATLRISLMEALCGFSRVVITTLDDRGLKYTHKVTDGKVIRPRDVFKIPGEGMPIGKKSDEKGDLYLDVDIEFPEDRWLTDPSQLETLRKLLSSNVKEQETKTQDSHEIIDEVTLENGDLSEMGGGGWMTDDENDGDDESDGVPPQCTHQ